MIHGDINLCLAFITIVINLMKPATCQHTLVLLLHEAISLCMVACSGAISLCMVACSDTIIHNVTVCNCELVLFNCYCYDT